jgi:DNA repair exonuclease SbcCD ATPase subunit
MQRLAELAKENESLSNRLAQATAHTAPSENPSRELLRLRGEVGVLRRQLQELESLTNAQSSNHAAVADSAEEAQIQAQYMRLKTLIDKVGEESQPGSIPEALLVNGVQDGMLSTMLCQLTLAQEKLATLQKDRGPDDPEIKDLRDQMSELSNRIQTRSDAVVQGLNAQLTSLKEALGNGKKATGGASGNSE